MTSSPWPGGALAGIYTLAGGKARQTMGTGVYTTLCYGMCAAVVAVLALFTQQPLAGFDAAGWLGILAITVCAQLMGHTAFNHLLATMSPLLVSMIILLEIPGAALLAAAFLARDAAGRNLCRAGDDPGGARRRRRGTAELPRRCGAMPPGWRSSGRTDDGASGAVRYWPPRRAGWAVLTVWMARSSFAGKYTEKKTTMGALSAIFLTLCALYVRSKRVT